MIICSCNVLSDRDIRGVAVATVRAELLNARLIYDCLGCSMQCGRCARTVQCILNETVNETGRTFPETSDQTRGANGDMKRDT